jgi:phage tail protein X
LCAYRDRKLSVSLCVFRAPLQQAFRALCRRSYGHPVDITAEDVEAVHGLSGAPGPSRERTLWTCETGSSGLEGVSGTARMAHWAAWLANGPSLRELHTGHGGTPNSLE